jgi:PAS domain S-box-containing protein
MLIAFLPADLAYVRLNGSDVHDLLEVAISRRIGGGADLKEAIAAALKSWLEEPATGAITFSLPDPANAAPLQAIAVPIGHQGDLGVLVAASEAPAFPTSDDRLRLELAASHAGVVMRSRNAEDAAAQGERDLAELVDAAPVALQSIAPDGRILRASQAQLELLGYPRQLYVGRNFAEFFAEPERGEECLRRLQEGEDLRGYEAQLRCRDGRFKQVVIDCRLSWNDGDLVQATCFTRDVTEHKRAEETLGFLSEGDADYTCVACWDGRDLALESASDGFTRVTGYSPDEFNAQTAALAIHPDDIMTVLQDIERLLNGESVTNEARIKRKDGEVRWLRYLAQPSSGAGDPRFLRVHAAAQDITESKDGGERVYEAERRFRQMAASIREVFWLSDLWRTQIFYCSPACEQVWGRSCESFYEQPWSLLDSVVPEDQERFVASLEAQTRGEATEVEYRILRPDGSVRWIRDRSFPVREASGEVHRVAGVAEDITERKRAEQTSRFLAEASATLAELSDYPTMLQRIAALAVPEFADWCAVDMQEPDGSIHRLALTHAESSKVRLTEEVFRCYPPHGTDPFGPAQVLTTGEPEWAEHISESQLAGLGQDQQHREILKSLGLRSYICVPLRGGRGTLGAMTFVTSESGRTYDLEDLRAAEDLAHRAVIAIENANLLAELRESDKRKDEFLAVLAHELRNPLAPVSLAVHILRAKGGVIPELQRATDVIERQVRQMVRLVDDLLDVSRITRGKVALRKEQVELAAVIGNAIEGSRPLIEGAGHNLTVSLLPQPIFLDADPTRLAQVLLNLLNNAAKYMHRGGHIWLSTELDGDQVAIRIRDAGIGISPEMLSRIFDMFTQADSSLERSHGGLGIGLTLSQQLVEMHGGTIEAFSEGSGKGSEFVIRLPVAAEAAATARPERKDPEIPTSTRRRILLVDDNEDALETLEELLIDLGHDLRTASDGLEAVQAAAEHQPEVVVLDIGLPNLNGYEAASRIRKELGREVLLIALTGWGQEEDRRRAKEAGFDHHLTKPLDLDQLKRLLSG